MRRRTALAIVLALVGAAAPAHAGGWYMMIPPAGNTNYFWDAPLDVWTVAQSFDSAAACEHGMSFAQTHLSDALSEHYQEQLAGEGHGSLTTAKARQRLGYAVCVSSDDARLTAAIVPGVSWFMLRPQWSGIHVYSTLPLRVWYKAGTYSSNDECTLKIRQAQDVADNMTENDLVERGVQASIETMHEVIGELVCVASNDSRLGR